MEEVEYVGAFVDKGSREDVDDLEKKKIWVQQQLAEKFMS